MPYNRVVPRDLFNEASLLKCYGRLAILADEVSGLSVEDCFAEEGESFHVEQDPDSGSIYLANVNVSVRGKVMDLRRPLNSRAPWPLYVEGIAGEYIDSVEVFTDAGNLHPDFLSLLRLNCGTTGSKTETLKLKGNTDE